MLVERSSMTAKCTLFRFPDDWWRKWCVSRNQAPLTVHFRTLNLIKALIGRWLYRIVVILSSLYSQLQVQRQKWYTQVMENLAGHHTLRVGLNVTCELFTFLFTMQDISWLRDITSLPILIKGVLTAEDGSSLNIAWSLKVISPSGVSTQMSYWDYNIRIGCTESRSQTL